MPAPSLTSPTLGAGRTPRARFFPRQIPLARVVAGFVALALVAVTVLTGGMVWLRAERMSDTAMIRALHGSTEAAAQVFARALYGDWRDLGYLAQRAGALDPAGGAGGLRDVMDGMRGDGSRVSWIGYADTSGRVVEASGGLLVGEDVSQRPWFGAGLRAGFAGDVHDALLLSQRLRPNGGEPLRFVDLALPVRDGSGALRGVAGLHIDAAWVEQTLAETARMLGLDLFVLNSDGAVVMHSAKGPLGGGGIRALQAIRSGPGIANRLAWPDGTTYLAARVPAVTHADMPSFGWQLVGRAPAALVPGDLATLRATMMAAALGAGLLLAGLTALFVRRYIRPLTRLVDSAEGLAHGAPDRPAPKDFSSRESARLSAALARIGARIDRTRDD